MTKTQTNGKRRVDYLRSEFDHGRLSSGAYAAGQEIQAALEQALCSAGPAWQERVDMSTNIDAAVVHGLDAARQAVRMMERVERLVGAMDARIVRQVLVEGSTLEQIAKAEGKTSARSVGYIGERFRDALEALGRSNRAKGSDRRQARDAYSDLAGRYSAGVS